MAKQSALKRLRARTRLELQIIGDEILNELLPTFEEEFERRVAQGLTYELTSYDEWVADEVRARTGRGVPLLDA